MSDTSTTTIKVWEPIFVHWTQNPVGINVNGKFVPIDSSQPRVKMEEVQDAS